MLLKISNKRSCICSEPDSYLRSGYQRLEVLLFHGLITSSQDSSFSTVFTLSTETKSKAKQQQQNKQIDKQIPQNMLVS